MAPCPSEVDVFTVPHSRMKELVDRYICMLPDTNFSDVANLNSLLKNLLNTFKEFRDHEQIENEFIMTRLKDKMRELSIRSNAVCNCHSDNRLTNMIELVQDGFKCAEKTDADRINYGLQLKSALEDFTRHFLPHMEEEEKVFQPMLMKYFTVAELKEIKKEVIGHHQFQQEDDNHEYELLEKEDFEKSEKDLMLLEIQKSKEEKISSGIDKMPQEVMLKILSYMNPKDLCRCAQVSASWNKIAMDGSLWRVLHPVSWARGNWSPLPMVDIDKEEASLHCFDGEKCAFRDEDADIDESGDSTEDDAEDWQNEEYILAKKESKLMTNMVKYLLPKVGNSVHELHLAYSKGINNGLLYKILGQCPKIEVLDLTQTSISDIAFKGMEKKNGGTRLKHLNLSGCKKISDTTLKIISSAFRHQQVFSQETRDRCEAQYPKTREKNCSRPHMCSGMCSRSKRLSASNMQRGSGDKPVTNNVCESSQDLYFDRKCGLTEYDSGQNKVTGEEPHQKRSNNDLKVPCNLEYLNLSGCYMITDEGLSHLLNLGYFERLKFLDLSGCLNVTSATLTPFVALCKNLDPAELFYCDNVLDGPYPDAANGCQNLECSTRFCCRNGY